MTIDINEPINLKPNLDQIEIIWHVEDVIATCPTLTRKQAQEVLRRLQANHDASIGINWDVIEQTANELLQEPESEETITEKYFS